MRLAVYNPHDKPVEELAVIYGFNNGGSPGWYHAQLIASDGMGMGSCLCSSEHFIPGDLGLTEGSRLDRHESFKERFPDGYRMEYVPPDQVLTHPGLKEAYRLNQELAANATEDKSDGS